MPARTSSAAMSAWRSEKPSTRSGCSATMRSIFALVKAETRGFSLRARGGRTVKPEIPTMRQSSPRRYKVSVVSSVRQTIRCGNPEGMVIMLLCCNVGAHLGLPRLVLLRAGLDPAERFGVRSAHSSLPLCGDPRPVARRYQPACDGARLHIAALHHSPDRLRVRRAQNFR